ncbi:MAG: DNA topoisomerase I [Candidatus Thermoplasmatota archaeon]|nr:DNA topoisomerase I [Candidatus Thermoplasmatota archaeon]
MLTIKKFGIAMKLIICEKNIAARRIAYILSNGKVKNGRMGSTPIYEFTKDSEPWTVIGLRGHIVNLDFPAGFSQWAKTPPSELITVNPCKKITEKHIASSLKSLVDKNPFIVVATDYDREGELIGVEVVNLLKEYNRELHTIKRAKFSAITHYEIVQAFEKLANVDYNLSSAGEARQVIDLIWGAVLTRFISLTSRRLGKDFLSIGRVQSPTLALLVEREKTIKNFEPKTFWKIIAKLKKQTTFDAVHSTGQFWDKTDVERIYIKVKEAKKAKVSDVKKEVIKEYPPSPFSTTTFLQSASHLGLSAAGAMKIAEELYMGGLISYPRTDNTVYPPSLNIKGILQKLSLSPFAKEAKEVLTNGRQRPTRGKKQTTDHPPIHPVGVPQGSKLTPDQQKVYELICRRFLATLAKDAISETCDVSFDISGEPFQASGYRVIESHWKTIYPYFKEKKKPLPELTKGEELDIAKLTLKEDTTKPPQRYTQGSLIAKMEQLSLGTKSTRHEIISKLYSRRYITGNTLVPTSTAIAVIDALVNCDVVKPKMTAELEEDMNKIAMGKKTLEETIAESRQMLTTVMKELEKDKEKIRNNIQQAHREQNMVGTCPICGKVMIIRTSKKAKRFVGCTGYPQCTNTYSLPQRGAITKTEKKCPTCGAPVVRVKMAGKKGWILCLNSSCPSKRTRPNTSQSPSQ